MNILSIEVDIHIFERTILFMFDATMLSNLKNHLVKDLSIPFKATCIFLGCVHSDSTSIF